MARFPNFQIFKFSNSVFNPLFSIFAALLNSKMFIGPIAQLVRAPDS